MVAAMMRQATQQQVPVVVEVVARQVPMWRLATVVACVRQQPRARAGGSSLDEVQQQEGALLLLGEAADHTEVEDRSYHRLIVWKTTTRPLCFHSYFLGVLL